MPGKEKLPSPDVITRETPVKDRHHPAAATRVPEETLRPYLEQPFPSSDLVLLCSFDSDLDTECTARQLHRELLTAGFRGALARHLIRVSPVLRRTSTGYYRIQQFRR